jgi:integrase
MDIKQSAYANMAVPEYLELLMKLNEEGNLKTTLNDEKTDLIHTPTRKLTAQEEAAQRAWDAIQKVNNQAPRTVTSLWQAYLTQKRRFDLDNPPNREQKRVIRRFEKFMKFCPDVVINDTTPELIQQGLDDIVAAEEQRQMAPESIRRNLTEVVSAFNWTIKKYRLKWQKIEMPTIEDRPDYIPKAKDVLLTPEQVQFYNAAVDADTPLAAALLLMLHCGAMATEVARLRIDEDLHLDHQLYPYVAMLGGRRRQTKTPTRPRFVPIVFGLDLIRRRLPEAIETLGKLKDPSAKLNAELRKLTNNKKLTGHCLRHTFKMQTDNKLMSPEITYAIAGWAGGWINKVANKYGSAGFGENEQLQTLNKELTRVFEAIVEEDKQRLAHGSSNVLPFSGDKNK